MNAFHFSPGRPVFLYKPPAGGGELQSLRTDEPALTIWRHVLRKQGAPSGALFRSRPERPFYFLGEGGFGVSGAILDGAGGFSGGPWGAGDPPPTLPLLRRAPEPPDLPVGLLI